MENKAKLAQFIDSKFEKAQSFDEIILTTEIQEVANTGLNDYVSLNELDESLSNWGFESQPVKGYPDKVWKMHRK
ncbi:MAG: hypothetical protein WC760_06410 [Bacteroidia bacterium]|jgi:hypothetical protein